MVCPKDEKVPKKYLLRQPAMAANLPTQQVVPSTGFAEEARLKKVLTNLHFKKIADI